MVYFVTWRVRVLRWRIDRTENSIFGQLIQHRTKLDARNLAVFRQVRNSMRNLCTGGRNEMMKNCSCYFSLGFGQLFHHSGEVRTHYPLGTAQSCQGIQTEDLRSK